MCLHTDLDTDVFVFFALYMDNYIAPQQSYIEYPYRLCVHRYSLLIVFVTLSMTISCACNMLASIQSPKLLHQTPGFVSVSS